MKKTLLITVMALAGALAALGANPKREFRGAWLHTVYQDQYSTKTPDQCKKYLADQLDRLQEAGVNAVLFQVRPSADAFYDSRYEPWSRFLTKGGKAPEPYWDPLAYMCREAHRRGMELHAWINPYRVTTAKAEKLPAGHLYHKHPERFVTYPGDGKIYFDPGLPENRQHIIDVVNDIVTRYDVDGIHMDDYFYPYPANGKDFPDGKSYARYGKGMDRAAWRRQNVDLLIEGVHKAIRQGKKPWVRFGVSPFGIWRNASTDPRGSKTSGLQNYDALYADPLLWAEKGWIDYLIPQLYWELEHKKASYLVLVDWWAKAVKGPCQLYIGQDVDKCMTTPGIAPSKARNQLAHKVRLTREAETISGNCWWPGYPIAENRNGVADALKADLQSTVALVPEYTSIPGEAPLPVKGLEIKGKTLQWSAEMIRNRVSDQVRFVVYRFPKGVKADFSDPRYIVAVTPDTEYTVTAPGTYHVTALNRLNAESQPSKGITVQI